MVAGTDLPLAQDNLGQHAWGLWDATIDDVIIVDENNRFVEVYNLKDHPLSDDVNSAYYANYAELKAKLKAVAGE